MTATKTKDAPEVPTVLKETRADRSKAEMARVLSVEWMTYDMWEKGAWVPGDDHAQRIADATGRDLPDVVWMLYRARIRAKGVYVGSFSRFEPLALAG